MRKRTGHDLLGTSVLHEARARHPGPLRNPCAVQGPGRGTRDPDAPKPSADRAEQLGAHLKATGGQVQRRSLKDAAERLSLPVPSTCAWRSVRSGSLAGRTDSCRCRRRRARSRGIVLPHSFGPHGPLPERHSPLEFYHALRPCPVHQFDMRVTDDEERDFRM